jgi:DNA-binding XRE family transcriptional regulator
LTNANNGTIIENSLIHNFLRDKNIQTIALNNITHRQDTMNQVESVIGAKVRALRALFGMNQDEFASKAGIPRTKVSEIESGLYNPTKEYVTKIENNLGIDLNDPRIEQFLTLKQSVAALDQPESVAA